MAEICEYRAEWDDDLQPVGPPCGHAAVYAIIWTTTRQWSPACADHIDLLPDAPPHTVQLLTSFQPAFRIGR